MHPQLESKRFHSCIDFIEALDKCHQKEYYKRVLGICNNEKEALTKCLKEARFETVKSTIDEKRFNHKNIEKKWQKMDDEEYGEDAILKIILHRELAKRNAQENSNKD